MKITVFTPAYNRGYIIGELYRSLRQQTFTSFEWLVIDDGSTDRTKDLFDEWVTESNPFPIRYYKVENGGKHRAINKAVELARGEMFFIVDSDDHLTEDALESMAAWEAGLRESGFCGVAGNRGKHRNDYWGTTFQGEYVDATSLERKQYRITGDKAEVFYTRILRAYKFDEIEGEKFITEATVWDRIAHDGYKLRWFNQTIYISEYLEDGLTNSMKEVFARNPIGTAIYIKQQIKFYKYNWIGRLANYNLYYNFVKSSVGLRKASQLLDIPAVVLLGAIFLIRCKRMILK